MNTNKILLIALNLFCAVTLFAQTGKVTGVVIDSETSEPVPFLNVYTEDKAVGTTTDFDGNYELELPEGTHKIVFSSLEYGKTNKTVNVKAGQTTDLTIELGKSDIQMETILVKTDKYAKPIEDVISSMEVIKPTLIENKASTDVKTALEQAPGLTIVDNEPQLRGGSGYSFGAGSRVAVLVDDLPLLTGDAGRPSWGFVPVENIEQIEVIKGASSVLYGSAALNGVINIRTAYPKAEPQTKINLTTGFYDKPKQEEAKWWGEDLPFYSGINFFHSRRVKKGFSFVVGGNIFVERGFVGPPTLDAPDQIPLKDKVSFWNAIRFDPDDPRDFVIYRGDTFPTIKTFQYNDSLNTLASNHDQVVKDSLNNIKQGEFTNRFRFNFNTRKKSSKIKGLSYGLNGNIMYSRSSGSLLWANDSTGLYRAFPGALTTTVQTTFNLDPYIEHFDQRGNKYSLNTRVFHQNNNNDNNQANKNYVFYGEFRYQKNFQKIRNFTLSTGLMGSYVLSNSELFGQEDSLGNIDAVDRTAYNTAVYLQLDKKFWDRLNVTLGGRWEFFDVDGFSDNQPVFRAGASGRVAKATYVRASFGQGFRIPTISERFITTEVGGVPIVQNPDLKPEKSWNLEVGIKQGVKIGKSGGFLGYIDAAGFVSHYDDYVEFIADQWLPLNQGLAGYAFKSVNTGEARVTGFDFSIMGQGKFSKDFSLTVLAGYTFTKPITLNPNEVYGVTGTFGDPVTYTSSSSLTNPRDEDGNYYVDSSHNILKYRYQHLVKMDIEGKYKGLSLGMSFRLYSVMKNVDNFFLREAQIIGIDANGFREEHDHPEYVFDFRIAYEINENSKVAFIINNALNREYALRPLDIDAPRSFALQYTMSLTGKKKKD